MLPGSITYNQPADGERRNHSLFSNELLVFLFVFVFASVFYLFNIGFSDLWSDEIYTKTMLKGSLSEFYERFNNDLHPPLYYLALKILYRCIWNHSIYLEVVFGPGCTIGYVTGLLRRTAYLWKKRRPLFQCTSDFDSNACSLLTPGQDV